MYRLSKRIWIFTFVIFCVAPGYIYIMDPFNPSYQKYPSAFSSYSRGDIGFFMIDPETILGSLDNGVTDVFLPETRNMLEEVGWAGPALYVDNIKWHQSDYLEIAEALNYVVWKDSLTDWKIYQMSFYTPCADDLDGFRGNVNITYYKTAFEYGRIRYTTRFFFIAPEYLSVGWAGGGYFPHPIEGWKEIELSEITITADDALRIAEANGGKEARSQQNNSCNLDLLLMPEFYPGWLVANYDADFKILVDPYTGEIIK